MNIMPTLNGQKLADEIEALPPMVPSLLRLTELVGSGDYSLAEVEKLITYDQGLTLDTLKLANSATMVGRVRVASVKDAVVRLGGERLSKYLFSRWLGGSVKVPLRTYGIDAGRFWSHGVITALACEALSDGDEKSIHFSAGLLHDMGKIVLDHFALRLGISLDWVQVPDSVQLLNMEKDLFGMDHGEIGAAIMKNWNFPDSVIDAANSMQGRSISNPILMAAHEIDLWILDQELQLENPVLPSGIPEELAAKVLFDYQAIRATVGV